MKPSFFGVPMLNFGGGRPYVLVLVEDRRYPFVHNGVIRIQQKMISLQLKFSELKITDLRSISIPFQNHGISKLVKLEIPETCFTDSKPSKGGTNDSYGTYYNQWNCERNLHLA